MMLGKTPLMWLTSLPKVHFEEVRKQGAVFFCRLKKLLLFEKTKKTAEQSNHF
jgi:hypothetical protein